MQIELHHDGKITTSRWNFNHICLKIFSRFIVASKHIFPFRNIYTTLSSAYICCRIYTYILTIADMCIYISAFCLCKHSARIATHTKHCLITKKQRSTLRQKTLNQSQKPPPTTVFYNNITSNVVPQTTVGLSIVFINNFRNNIQDTDTKRKRNQISYFQIFTPI